MIDPVYMQLAGSLFFGHPIIVTPVETKNTETTAEQEFSFKEILDIKEISIIYIY